MIAASAAATTPRMIVPRRVVSSLVSRIEFTCVPPSWPYRESTAAQLPNAWKLQGCPLPPAFGSVYEIQWPQISPEGGLAPLLSLPPVFVVALYAPQSGGFPPDSDQPVT